MVKYSTKFFTSIARNIYIYGIEMEVLIFALIMKRVEWEKNRSETEW